MITCSLHEKEDFMKAVIQRVSRAKVKVASKKFAQIEKGLLVLLAISHQDAEEEVDWLAKKILNLRIFADEQGKMNLSVKDIGGSILVISQFTLYGDVVGGNRPSFSFAAGAAKAEKLYNLSVKKLKKEGIEVKTGQFGAMMQVSLTNDGPVTLIIER